MTCREICSMHCDARRPEHAWTPWSASPCTGPCRRSRAEPQRFACPLPPEFRQVSPGATHIPCLRTSQTTHRTHPDDSQRV
eukprot:361880-Chlamydomonas_euryale.AAC.11